MVRFLKHALRQLAAKLLVIWDGSLMHRANKALKKFLQDGAAAQVQLEQLTGYARLCSGVKP